MVAPGIAEALFATAIGLFAAIPAVIAYNRLSHGLDRLEARLGRFADRFHATLSRELEVEAGAATDGREPAFRARAATAIAARRWRRSTSRRWST